MAEASCMMLDTMRFPNPEMTARQAAQAYAAHRNRVACHWRLPDGQPLAVEFQFVNGSAWYRAEWHGDLDGAYTVGRLA